MQSRCDDSCGWMDAETGLPRSHATPKQDYPTARLGSAVLRWHFCRAPINLDRLHVARVKHIEVIRNNVVHSTRCGLVVHRHTIHEDDWRALTHGEAVPNATTKEYVETAAALRLQTHAAHATK